jgi:predicted ATP-binding protein involved in virulence
VVPSIAKAFPKLQFVLTTHSPIVAGTLTRHNVFVMEAGEGGTSDIVQRDDRIHGLDAEQVLLSPYFGLSTTRAPDAEDELQKLSDKAVKGDLSAAVQYTRQLAGLARKPDAANGRKEDAKIRR